MAKEEDIQAETKRLMSLYPTMKEHVARSLAIDRIEGKHLGQILDNGVRVDGRSQVNE